MRNAYEVRGNVTAIFLSHKDGRTSETLIDTDDLGRAQEYPLTWGGARGYVSSLWWHPGGSYDRVMLHRWLLKLTDPTQIVDHINRDPRDNRRGNLRVGTQALNMQNLSIDSQRGRSGVLGVVWNRQHGRWMARQNLDKQVVYLGLFDTLEEAKHVVQAWRALNKPFSDEARMQVPDVGARGHAAPLRLNTRSGIRNVYWNDTVQGWTVQITADGIHHYLGWFRSKEEAAKVAEEARARFVRPFRYELPAGETS